MHRISIDELEFQIILAECAQLSARLRTETEEVSAVVELYFTLISPQLKSGGASLRQWRS